MHLRIQVRFRQRIPTQLRKSPQGKLPRRENPIQAKIPADRLRHENGHSPLQDGQRATHPETVQVQR